MTESWYIRLLGGLSAAQGEQVISRFSTQKTGGLLAYLAFYRERSHLREALQERFWSQSSLDKARSSLSVALNALRGQFGDCLLTDRFNVRLDPDAFTTDVQHFVRAREAATRATTDTQAIAFLVQAEELYTGELLPGFYDEWVLAERERLADHRLFILHRLTTLLINSGEFERALEYAHRAIRENPADEESQHLLAQVHTLSAPSISTKKGATEKEKQGVRTIRSDDSQRGNLPRRLSKFFGRTEEIAHIRDLFVHEGAGIVTLTGMGGVGKTRLAQEAADQLHDHFSGGVFFAPLVDLREPERLLEVVRDALHIPSASAAVEPISQIVEKIASFPGPCLLLLDNLEQLLGRGPLDKDGGATIIRQLRDRVPTLQLMITSRQLLGIEHEQECPVLPLPFPPVSQLSSEQMEKYAAVQLFVDRVQARRIGFRVTPQNATSVAALCARLEGVPLAIELAAARAKMFTPSQILERLNESFAHLESQLPELPIRHRSLRAVAEWSYQLLPVDERLLFARLSVFRGRWDIDAAESVCSAGDSALQGQIVECLTRLRDASLILADEIAVGDATEMRLRLSEPLREFAASLLDRNEAVALRQYHTDYFVARAEMVVDNLLGAAQHVWFDRLETDHDNFRSVLGRQQQGDETALRLASALARFWCIRGHAREGAQWFERLIPTNEQTVSVHTLYKASSGAGAIAYALSDFVKASAFYEQNLRLARKIGNTASIGSALHNLGNIAYREGNYDMAWDMYSEALTIYRDQKNLWYVASSLGNLGNIADARGDYDQARILQEECLVIAQQIEDRRMQAYTLHNLGNLGSQEGNREYARAQYEASMILTRALGDQRHIATLSNSIAFLELEAGNTDTAYTLFINALRTLRQVGDQLNMVYSLEGMGNCIAMKGDNVLQAANLWGTCEAAREALNSPLLPLEDEQYEKYRNLVRSQADNSMGRKAWSDGRNYALLEAVQMVLEPESVVK